MTDIPIPADSDLSDAEAEDLMLLCGHAPGPEPLSPAAQAVLDAANRAYDQAATVAQGTAAVLRAVAEQVGPPETLPPCYTYSAPAEMWHYEFKLKAQRQILAIADELESNS